MSPEEPTGPLRGESIGPLKVDEVLFGANGVYPPAGIGVRVAAFLMDYLLLLSICLVLLLRFILPHYFPEGYNAFNAWVEASLAADTPSGAASLGMSESIAQMMAFANSFMIVTFYLYFSTCDYLFKGVTLGKRTFHLRVLQRPFGSTPTLVNALVRAAVKTLGIFLFYGLPALVFLIVALSNPLRRSVHDWLARTLVVRRQQPRVLEMPPSSEKH